MDFSPTSKIFPVSVSFSSFDGSGTGTGFGGFTIGLFRFWTCNCQLGVEIAAKCVLVSVIFQIIIHGFIEHLVRAVLRFFFFCFLSFHGAMQSASL